MKNIQYWLVGGAVRDRLLGLPVQDRDWVVTGATPDDLLDQGFKPVGSDFPVFCIRKPVRNTHWHVLSVKLPRVTTVFSFMLPRT